MHCSHPKPHEYGVPNVGEIHWCPWCGAMRVVSQGHEHQWEIPTLHDHEDIIPIRTRETS